MLKRWRKSDLWPRTEEYATSIVNDGYMFSNFCPETTYDRFGLFASYLSRYADDIDRAAAHSALAREAVPHDWRWNWQSMTPMHFTDCPLYSVLQHRDTEQSHKLTKEPWYKRPFGLISIGVSIAVLTYAAKWILEQLGLKAGP